MAMRQLVVWTFDAQRYALPLSAVERVVRAVEVTPLPAAPDIVCGVVNVHGQIVPVVDVRRRFHLPARETTLADQIVIAQSARRKVAFFIDAIGGVAECEERDVVPGNRIVPGLERVAGVAKLEDGLILIHDLDSFLSLDEEEVLDKAMHDAN
jgi:purine-binding chemotaxis protein CheW